MGFWNSSDAASSHVCQLFQPSTCHVRDEIEGAGRKRCDGIWRVPGRHKNLCVKVKRCMWEIFNKTFSLARAYCLIRRWRIDLWENLHFGYQLRWGKVRRAVTTRCATAFSLSFPNRFPAIFTLSGKLTRISPSRIESTWHILLQRANVVKLFASNGCFLVKPFSSTLPKLNGSSWICFNKYP